MACKIFGCWRVGTANAVNVSVSVFSIAGRTAVWTAIREFPIFPDVSPQLFLNHLRVAVLPSIEQPFGALPIFRRVDIENTVPLQLHRHLALTKDWYASAPGGGAPLYVSSVCARLAADFEPISNINHVFVGSQRAVSPDWPRHLPSASHVDRRNGM